MPSQARAGSGASFTAVDFFSYAAYAVAFVMAGVVVVRPSGGILILD
jgi:hypothetical protein